MDIPASVVYFSFDDGPSVIGDTTERLLDVLHQYHITALFFLLGENAEQYPHLVKRMHDEGHYIASHGYADKWAINMNDDEFRNNLKRGEAAIAHALGRDSLPMRLYRPHGGYYSASQQKICSEEGYAIVPVTIRVYDAVANADEREKVIQKTINLVKKRNGGLILLHDGRDSYTHGYDRSWIPDAVEQIINALLDAGFDVRRPLTEALRH